jgi:hypothetical protein
LAASFEITLTQEFAADCFGELLQRLHQTTGRQAGVLVDEYDMPMQDALNEAPEIIEGFGSFYKISTVCSKALTSMCVSCL